MYMYPTTNAIWALTTSQIKHAFQKIYGMSNVLGKKYIFHQEYWTCHEFCSLIYVEIIINLKLELN